MIKHKLVNVTIISVTELRVDLYLERESNWTRVALQQNRKHLKILSWQELSRMKIKGSVTKRPIR
jgi:hypothetical protein